MKTGEKLKRIRKFRGYNQPEFAIMVGLGENTAPRIAQYESGYRVPSPKLLKTMAEVLDCNPLALMDVTGQNVEELMMMFFWLEEEHPGMFHAFRNKETKLTGDCAKCPKAAECRAGCSAAALSTTGKLTDNLFCVRQIETEQILKAFVC